jgi:hypothetical protein
LRRGRRPHQVLFFDHFTNWLTIENNLSPPSRFDHGTRKEKWA